MEDVVVVGAGAMGSSAAWQLARAGAQVTLLDRFDPGHTRGSSHGATRIFRSGYRQSDYVRLAVQALRWWRELEAESGETLLDLTGCVDHGPGHVLQPIVDSLVAAGLKVQEVPPASAAGQWPGITFDERVIHHTDAGRIYADRTVAALHACVQRRGAQIRYRTRVAGISVAADGSVRVRTDTGALAARHVVVAAGAWTTALLAGLTSLMPLPRLTVTQEQPAHMRPHDPAGEWPSFLHHGDPHVPSPQMYGVYGLLTPGEGVKVGLHGTGVVCDPDTRSFRPDERGVALLERYVAQWLPGVDPATARFDTCLYTTTENEDFIIDRVGPVTVAAGFSGHGFKFTPVIGHLIADLVTGERRSTPSRFSLERRAPVGPRRRADLTLLLQHLSKSHR